MAIDRRDAYYRKAPQVHDGYIYRVRAGMAWLEWFNDYQRERK